MSDTRRTGSTGSSEANNLMVYSGLRDQEIHSGINIVRHALEITTRASAFGEPTQVQRKCAEAGPPQPYRKLREPRLCMRMVSGILPDFTAQDAREDRCSYDGERDWR